ncbi:MAG: MgtC/SapB family protein [Candidatus Paceibacterota bacterium]
MPHVTDFIDPTSVMLFKLVLAMLLGGVIGTERAVIARQSAGTRTFGLVALGACLFVITSNYVNSAFMGSMAVLPLAVPAAIVTGIGFLGGGLIIFRADALHGVTTAAGLWLVAALGVSIGFGMYAVSIFTTILALIMFTGMWYIENRFKHWFIVHNGDTHEPETAKAH